MVSLVLQSAEFAAGAFAIAFGIYALLVVTRPDPLGLPRSVAIVGVLSATGVFFLRSRLDGASIQGALHAGTLLSIAIVAITRGRPVDLFDSGISDEERSLLTPDALEDLERRESRIHKNQLVFLAFAVTLVVVHEVLGFDFID